jgi:hypothetical protein
VSKKNGLHRHYDRLTAEEGFRLDVLAMARGDEQESERLVSSCPRSSCFTEVFVHEYGRWTQNDPGPAHPFVAALRRATNLEALMGEHGTVLGHWVGEDAIIRGEAERPGSPVRWNEDETACS